MATEIELKAHVGDCETLKTLLFTKADYSGSFEKEDVYWASSEPHAPVSRIRVRREECRNAEGSLKTVTFATHKIKEVRDGIEVNDELEFAVTPEAEFERLLTRMGYKPGFCKQKRGWAFSRNGITAELVEVANLGWFIELEILETGGGEKAVADGKKKLLGFLSELGIDRQAIESRYYSEMLREHS